MEIRLGTAWRVITMSTVYSTTFVFVTVFDNVKPTSSPYSCPNPYRFILNKGKVLKNATPPLTSGQIILFHLPDQENSPRKVKRFLWQLKSYLSSDEDFVSGVSRWGGAETRRGESDVTG